MTMTDPIADMLARLRNGSTAYKDEVAMPSSKTKVAIADILKREGYIRDFEIQRSDLGPALTVHLKYGPNRERTIAGLKRISKPGLRVYAQRDGIPRVLGGLGIAIISTSRGLLTDKQAVRAGVGGEVLAYVW
jgi:small subunit ribosomal protein S8